MFQIIDVHNKKMAHRPKQLTPGQIRSVTQTVSQLIAITVAEAKEDVIALLIQFNVPIRKNAEEKQVIAAIMKLIAQKDLHFNLALERIIISVLPDLRDLSDYDQFQGNQALSGAKQIGGGAASGAAGGGWVGAILGTVGGVFGFANSVKQQKIEQQKASAMTLSNLLQYKTAKLNSNQQSGLSSQSKIIIALFILTAIILGWVWMKKTQKVQS